MTTLTPQSTVGDLVRAQPNRARVFERLKIDYCCGGKLPLADACAKVGVDLDDVLQQIQQADATADPSGADLIDADTMTLTDLADHIEQTHHAYLRDELPRLDFMTDKVFKVHGEHEPRLGDVRRAFVALRDELTAHMMKEEQIFFPMIRQLDARVGPTPFHCGSVANPIGQMELEHERAGDALAIMRRETDDYQPPDWACNTYRAMLDSLARLERDMHQHVHKENNILFPKAIERESRLAAGASVA